eukprot:scaffold9192_cov17-Prasinocladus_malaysianus.AAC.1
MPLQAPYIHQFAVKSLHSHLAGLCWPLPMQAAPPLDYCFILVTQQSSALAFEAEAAIELSLQFEPSRWTHSLNWPVSAGSLACGLMLAALALIWVKVAEANRPGPSACGNLRH